METVDTLLREHRCIGLMLDCLEELVRGAERGGALEVEDAAELLFLFESFADGQHQEKEEGVLFPWLLDRVSGGDEELLRQLLAEHVYERESLPRLRERLAQAARGPTASPDAFVREAKVYAREHRNHLQHEVAGLVPLLQRLLTPRDDAELAEGFRQVEAAGHDSAGVFDSVRALAHKLGLSGGDEAA